jgi:hypothetical protein
MENLPSKKTFIIAMAVVALVFVVAIVSLYMYSLNRPANTPSLGGFVSPDNTVEKGSDFLKEKQKTINSECKDFLANNDFDNPDKAFFNTMNKDLQNRTAYYGYIVAASIERKENSMCSFVDEFVGGGPDSSSDCGFSYFTGRLFAEKCSDEVKKDVVQKWTAPNERAGIVEATVNALCDGGMKKNISECEQIKDKDKPYFICRALASDDPGQCSGVKSGMNESGGSGCKSFYYLAKTLLSDYAKDLTDRMDTESKCQCHAHYKMEALMLKNRSTVPFEERAQTAWNSFCDSKSEAFIGTK